jgi:hypothetical protein
MTAFVATQIVRGENFTAVLDRKQIAQDLKSAVDWFANREKQADWLLLKVDQINHRTSDTLFARMRNLEYRQLEQIL